MQDYSFDDYDYTLCVDCHSSIQPYNNISITTITQYNNNNPITLSQLSLINPYTKNLLSYNYLHCSKCGLYIKIHPKHNNDSTSIQKIFICSNYNKQHKYCLCYHCGLLYGINPNHKTINILSIIQSNPIILPTNTNKERDDEECSLEEVIDGGQNCSDEDDETQKRMEENKSKIDESYLHLIALQTKLNLLSSEGGGGGKDINVNGNNYHKSCPSSPDMKKINNWPLSSSLRGSPLLGPTTPSPRVLGKDVDESEKKWQKYLVQQHSKEKDNSVQSTDKKLEKQQRKLEELQKLQRELSMQKRNSEQFAKLFRNGIYSKENHNKHMTNFKFEV